WLRGGVERSCSCRHKPRRGGGLCRRYARGNRSRHGEAMWVGAFRSDVHHAKDRGLPRRTGPVGGSGAMASTRGGRIWHARFCRVVSAVALVSSALTVLPKPAPAAA